MERGVEGERGKEGRKKEEMREEEGSKARKTGRERWLKGLTLLLVLIFLSLFHTTDLYTVKLLLKPLNKVFSFVSYFYCSYKFL